MFVQESKVCDAVMIGAKERESEREREKGEEGREQSVNESVRWLLIGRSRDQRERQAHGAVTLDTDQLTRLRSASSFSRAASFPPELPRMFFSNLILSPSYRIHSRRSTIVRDREYEIRM